MRRRDALGTRQVGDRARHLHDAVVGRAEIEALHRPLEQRRAAASSGQWVRSIRGVHHGVGVHPSASRKRAACTARARTTRSRIAALGSPAGAAFSLGRRHGA